LAFSLLILPLGIIVGFKATPLPFLLAKAGVSVDRIATISSLGSLPGVLVFLWAPLVDIKFRRRTWLAIAIFGTALSVCTYFPLIGSSHLTLMTALILVGGIADSMVLAACGGLLVRTLSAAAQAKASAWWQAGFMGGGALGGAAIMWLTARMPLFAAGLSTAIVIALPGFLRFLISEPAPARSQKLQGRLTRISQECGQ
jgi:PAT family beta-lactamase induction signal transducer AmpG